MTYKAQKWFVYGEKWLYMTKVLKKIQMYIMSNGVIYLLQRVLD